MGLSSPCGGHEQCPRLGSSQEASIRRLRLRLLYRRPRFPSGHTIDMAKSCQASSYISKTHDAIVTSCFPLAAAVVSPHNPRQMGGEIRKLGSLTMVDSSDELGAALTLTLRMLHYLTWRSRRYRGEWGGVDVDVEVEVTVKRERQRDER